MDLHVDLPGLALRNPVMGASGCVGYGRELAEFYDLSAIGGISVKSVSPAPRAGNPTPRIAETPMGMLNAIGLQNKGVDYVKTHEIPFLKTQDTCVMVNVAGSTEEDYVTVIEALNDEEAVDAFELNISCPNVKHGGMALGTDPVLVEKITRMCVTAAKKPVYVKLSPNVTDIVATAKAAEKGGAAGLVMINTLMGMRIDLKTGRPLLANETGGLSGPAIKPVAIRMVYQAAQAVHIPIIGCGGILSAEDVLEFLNAGASAVQVGCANFKDPYIMKKIAEDLPAVLARYGYESVAQATGRSFR